VFVILFVVCRDFYLWVGGREYKCLVIEQVTSLEIELKLTSVFVCFYMSFCVCVNVCGIVGVYVWECMCGSVCVGVYVWECMCGSVCVGVYV
jgi:hypothetical protein